MADRIVLTGLRARGHHGVFDHEKRDGQEFSVDVTCWLDMRAAVDTDDITATVDYAELAAMAHRVVTGPRFNLIEKVAGTIADEIMDTYPMVFAVEVTVHKPHAPIVEEFSDVAVVARRSRGRS